MKFMFLLSHDNAWFASSPDVFKKTADEYETYRQSAVAAGTFVDGFPLKGDVKTVRVRNGKNTTTDGPPFQQAEGHVGYFILDLPSMDAAVKEAARIPAARLGSIEVRPFMDV